MIPCYKLIGLVAQCYIVITDIDDVHCVPYDPLTVIEQVRQGFGTKEKIYYHNEKLDEVHEMVMIGNQFSKFKRLTKEVEDGVKNTAAHFKILQEDAMR